MAARPQVSVVIPTRNRWPMLAAALRSVARQEQVDVETIVVDDASTDETPERLADLPDAVRIVRLPARGGVTAARNAGLAEATAPWVAFLDDDDQWAPMKLQRQLLAVTAQGAAFAYSGVIVIHGTLPAWVDPAPDAHGLERRLLERSVIPAGSSNVLVRADLVRELGGFDEHFDHIADWDLWIRLAATSSAATVEEIDVAYVTHPGTMVSMVTPAELRIEFGLLRDKHSDRSRRAGVAFDELAFERWIALGRSRQRRRVSAALAYLGIATRHRSLPDAARGAAALAGERLSRAGRRPRAVPEWVELR